MTTAPTCVRGQKKSVVWRFMKAPWPVSVFQQVRPFSAEAHTMVR